MGCIVHRVTESQTRLSDFHFLSHGQNDRLHESILLGKHLTKPKKVPISQSPLSKIHPGKPVCAAPGNFRLLMDHLSSGRWIPCNFLQIMDIGM